MQLAVIEDFAEVFKGHPVANLTPEARIASDLVEIAWMSLFELYSWLRDRDQSES